MYKAYTSEREGEGITRYGYGRPIWNFLVLNLFTIGLGAVFVVMGNREDQLLFVIVGGFFLLISLPALIKTGTQTFSRAPYLQTLPKGITLPLQWYSGEKYFVPYACILEYEIIEKPGSAFPVVLSMQLEGRKYPHKVKQIFFKGKADAFQAFVAELDKKVGEKRKKS